MRPCRNDVDVLEILLVLIIMRSLLLHFVL